MQLCSHVRISINRLWDSEKSLCAHSFTQVLLLQKTKIEEYIQKNAYFNCCKLEKWKLFCPKGIEQK